jgi:hypothetical protein
MPETVAESARFDALDLIATATDGVTTQTCDFNQALDVTVFGG